MFATSTLFEGQIFACGSIFSHERQKMSGELVLEFSFHAWRTQQETVQVECDHSNRNVSRSSRRGYESRRFVYGSFSDISLVLLLCIRTHSPSEKRIKIQLVVKLVFYLTQTSVTFSSDTSVRANHSITVIFHTYSPCSGPFTLRLSCRLPCNLTCFHHKALETELLRFYCENIIKG